LGQFVRNHSMRSRRRMKGVVLNGSPTFFEFVCIHNAAKICDQSNSEKTLDITLMHKFKSQNLNDGIILRKYSLLMVYKKDNACKILLNRTLKVETHKSISAMSFPDKSIVYALRNNCNIAEIRAAFIWITSKTVFFPSPMFLHFWNILGPMLWSQYSEIFANFRRTNWRIFSKTKDMIFFSQTSSSFSKKCQLFRQIFWRKYF
jgi:hypothetical protein